MLPVPSIFTNILQSGAASTRGERRVNTFVQGWQQATTRPAAATALAALAPTVLVHARVTKATTMGQKKRAKKPATAAMALAIRTNSTGAPARTTTTVQRARRSANARKERVNKAPPAVATALASLTSGVHSATIHANAAAKERVHATKKPARANASFCTTLVVTTARFLLQEFSLPWVS